MVNDAFAAERALQDAVLAKLCKGELVAPTRASAMGLTPMIARLEVDIARGRIAGTALPIVRRWIKEANALISIGPLLDAGETRR
jgi:hypothetical protein